MPEETERFLVNAYGERWSKEDFALHGWDSDCAGWEHTRVRRLAMETIIPFCKGVGIDIGSQKCPVTNTAMRLDWDRRFYANQNFDLTVSPKYELSFMALDYIAASHVIEDAEDPIKQLQNWSCMLRPGGYLCLLMPDCNVYPKPGEPNANAAHKYPTYPRTYLDWLEQLTATFSIVQHDACAKLRREIPGAFDSDCVYQKVGT